MPEVPPPVVPGQNPAVWDPASSPPVAAVPKQAQSNYSGWVQGPNGWVRVPVYPPGTLPSTLPPTLFQRFWPGPGNAGAAPRAAISLIVVAAVVGAVGLVPSVQGFGWFVTALALTALSIATGLAPKRAVWTSASGQRLSVPAARLPVTEPPVAEVTVAEPSVLEPDPSSAAVPESAATESAGTESVGPDSVGADAAPEAVGVPDAAVAEVARTSWVSRISFAEHGERAFWGACALALVSVGTFRAAGWLFFWCVVFALGSAAMALAGGRTVKALFASVWAPVIAPFRSPPWIARGLRRTSTDGSRILIASAVSVLLLLVFGGLFASADAEFRHVLGSILPPLKPQEVGRAILCFIVVGVVACGVAFLSAARPKFDSIVPATAKLVRRAEWVLPLTVLNLLFAVFVFIQLTVLFGGDVNLQTASHAYLRGYAHNGFWQLLVVSLLTLTILLITSRIAPRETKNDRVLLRVLLGGLTAFSIVIVLAALKRVDTYEHLFGYTRLRVAVAGIELWFGLLFVLILIAGITLRAAWLPRVIVGSLVLSLLAGAIANPDLYVAQHNVDRYRDTGKLSIGYMQQMSPDALSAIQQLPPDLRACALVRIADVEYRGDDWRTWNFPRVAARNALRDYVAPKYGACPELVRPPSR